MGNDVQINIGAEDTGVAAVMAQVQETITTGVEQIKASVGGISDAFAAVNAAFLAFTAVLAGGAAFKEAISSTVNMTVESVALGHQLGISATEASQLKVALDSVHVTQDQYATASDKVTMALKKNEAGFHDAGVATRDANGNLLSSQQIMQNLTAHLLEFKEGQDRNLEGVRLLGKGYEAFVPTMRVTKEVIADATKESDALGLTIGKENVDAVNKYRTAMDQVEQVIKGVEKVIAEAIMPALTAMGTWFHEIGPQVVGAFRAAMTGLGVVFGAVWTAIKAVWDVLSSIGSLFAEEIQIMFGGESLTTMQFFVNVIKVIEIAFIAAGAIIQAIGTVIAGIFERLRDVIVTWANVVKAAISLDWAGVQAAWNKGTQKIEDDAKARFQKIATDAQTAGQKIQDALLGDPSKAGPVTPTDKPPPGKKGAPEGGKDTSDISEFEEELTAFKANMAQKLAAQGDFQEFSKQMDKNYWQAILDTYELNKKEQASIQKKIDADTIAIAKEQYAGELADLKAQESQYKGNLEAKLQLAKEYAAKIAAAEGGDSAKAKQAEGQVLAIERDLAAQKLAIAKTNQTAIENLELARIDEAQKMDQALVASGIKTNAQLLADERNFENQRYAIKLQALQQEKQAELDSVDSNPAKVAQINAQILALQTSHEAQMRQLTLKSVQEQDKYWTDLFSSMNSGFQSTISGFLKGTASIGATIKGLFQDITNAIADTLAKMLSNWITTQIQQQIMGKVSALANITAAAALAGANAYASTAAIPVVGPELAPAAAAAAYSGAMSFGVAASALGGYDIPAGVNPIVQAHAKEMVLPPGISDGFRSIIAGLSSGGGNGGGSNRPSGPIQIQLHPDAMRMTMQDFLASEFARSLATT